MYFKAGITQARLKELLSYEKNTGRFFRRVGKRQGREAGSTTPYGCRTIWVDGKSYFAHRLAWLYVYGKWPRHYIDHINHNGVDNRISNLREATNAQNQWNSTKQRNNKSGFKGVTFHKGERKWRAKIWVQGKNKFLGRFNTAEEAGVAYKRAAKELYGEYARLA